MGQINAQRFGGITMNWIKGRPDDWLYISGYSGDCSSIREAGADDMLSALLKWLFEPCDEHPQGSCLPSVLLEWVQDKIGYFYLHRKDCPSCMAELRGEK
jgi:hypothetical protein